MDPYGYAANNPVNATDPTGMICWWIFGFHGDCPDQGGSEEPQPGNITLEIDFDSEGATVSYGSNGWNPDRYLEQTLVIYAGGRRVWDARKTCRNNYGCEGFARDQVFVDCEDSDTIYARVEVDSPSNRLHREREADATRRERGLVDDIWGWMNGPGWPW